MSNKTKKAKKRFAKLRERLAKSKNYIEVTHVIALSGRMSSDTPPVVACTCGYKSEPDDNMIALGILAKKHEDENQGHFRRHHPYA